MKGLSTFLQHGARPLYCSPIKTDGFRAPWFHYGQARYADMVELSRAMRPEAHGRYNVHTFTDDKRFESLFNAAVSREKLVSNAMMATGPDYSIPSVCDLPLALFQIWRSNVVTQELQRLGLVTIPVVQWGPPIEPLLDYACSCYRPGGAVAIRAPNLDARDDFDAIWDYMANRIKPAQLWVIGGVVNDYGAEVQAIDERSISRRAAA